MSKVVGLVFFCCLGKFMPISLGLRLIAFGLFTDLLLQLVYPRLELNDVRVAMVQKQAELAAFLLIVFL